MVLISTIVIGSAVVVSSIGYFKMGQDLVSNGIIGSVHYLGGETLIRPSLLELVGGALSSPFIRIWDFLLEFILTPIIVIAFAILFIVAQYWLFKLYFKLGTKLFEGLLKLMEKINLTGEKFEIIAHMKNMFKFN